MANWIRPGKTIGIIGGGSVSRLLALSAKKLGYCVGVLDSDPRCLAKSIADWHIEDDLNSEEALMSLAMKSDVVLYETEAVQFNLIKKISRAVAVPQGEELLSVSQDRMLQKAFLESVRVNIAPFATIVTLEDIKEAVQSIGFPCVLKSNNTDERFKQHYVLYSEEDIPGAQSFLKRGTCVLEAWIISDKELCIGIVKDAKNKVQVYPITEMKYEKDVFFQSISPARVDESITVEVERIGRVIADNIDFIGVMAVEVFSTESGALYVNEIVAHPHRANHFTSNLAGASQYDAMIKLVTGWPFKLEFTEEKSLVMRPISFDKLNQAYTQAQLKGNWDFTFYGNQKSESTEEVGHVTIKTDNMKQTLRQLNDTFS